ncbi:MAG TPA: EamA family transporter [Terriglobales bacterium]|nr:EamA family transporter [Terriglobales bacterium]
MTSRARRGGILAASLGIYLAWGSAYLAMKVGLETLPPLVLAGTRLLLAGCLMGGAALAMGHRLQLRHWKPLLGAAALLFLGGHGFLYWGQERVSSGLGAVLFATIPLWIVLIEGLSPHGIRLGWRAGTGLGLGTAGILLLVGPTQLLGSGRVDLAGAAAISLASLSWALGSIYCTRAKLPASAALAGGMEMLLGGVLLLIVAGAMGETRGFHWSQVSTHSWLAVAYLVGVSSMIGFSCYLWLLKVASAARVSTYAYINPLVAVGLGWGLAGETVTARTLGAIAMLLGAVVLIVREQSKRPGPLLAAEVESQGAVAS